jgi:hypothetical protein
VALLNTSFRQPTPHHSLDRRLPAETLNPEP